ncbi:MAG: RNA polymerase sigma factor [Bacteroidota bacterium]
MINRSNKKHLKEEELIKNRHSKKGQKMLFDAYYDEMFQVSKRYLKINEDVQDTLCEAFIRVFKQVGSFEYRGEGSLKRWIKTIVINESLRYIERNRKFLYSDNIEEAEDLETVELDENLDMEHINSIVENLPDGYRIIFMMFIIEGYSHREIANHLGISESTSKSQLFKARMQIMKELQKIEDYESFRGRKEI